jgi:hypothetical protein
LLPEPLELFAELLRPALDAPPMLLDRDALDAPPDALPPPLPAVVELDRGPEADAPPAIPPDQLDAPELEYPLDELIMGRPPPAMPLVLRNPPEGAPPEEYSLPLVAELHAPINKGAIHKAQRQARTLPAAILRPLRAGAGA